MTAGDPPPKRTGRMDAALPGVPIAAKLSLIGGVGLGMVAGIVASFAEPDLERPALLAGIVIGLLGAGFFLVRARASR